MKWQRFLVLLMIASVPASPALGGIIFGKKKPKPDPMQRVPELISLLRTSQDERDRANAAEELRDYDYQAFPEIVPALIDVLHTDSKSSVRAEAAQSLGRLRPISLPAGQALEQALDKDSSMRVRLQARSALLQYHWHGYRGLKKDVPPNQTQEPPLAPPLPSTPATTVNSPPVIDTTPPVIRLTPRPLPEAPPATASGQARPLPIGPAQPVIAPSPQNRKDSGPDLNPPY